MRSQSHVDPAPVYPFDVAPDTHQLDTVSHRSVHDSSCAYVNIQWAVGQNNSIILKKKLLQRVFPYLHWFTPIRAVHSSSCCETCEMGFLCVWSKEDSTNERVLGKTAWSNNVFFYWADGMSSFTGTITNNMSSPGYRSDIVSRKETKFSP